MPQQRVGFIGLGIMGGRMARHVLEKGYPLVVWNRSRERCAPLEQAGARVAATPRELAEQVDVVVTCVSDPNAVGRIMFPEDGVRAGAHRGMRYLETSTISPGLVLRVAECLGERGAEVLEGPVTGSKLGAERGTLLFMTGGRAELHEELLPLMMAMGSKAIHCGPLGQASVTKLIGNTLISFMLEGFCEGVLVGRRAGVPLEKILEVVMASGFASPYYPFKGAAIANRDWDTHFSIDLLMKDQDLMLEQGFERGVPMPGLAAIREVFHAARAQGFGQEDIAAVIKALERAAGE
jgi:3-hydroxyisobutyrate dehydrogenase-like beta-hydroxyacid dehydrogenase